MNIQFATCERKKALEFLRQYYPSRNLKDEGKTKALLDLVQADIIRIPDPKFHPSGQVYPSKNYDKSKAEEYLKIMMEFQNE